MADNDPSTGKSSKKHRKRKGKKEGGTAGSVDFAKPVDPVEDLRQRLSEAKLTKNNELANRLRQQLWIAQDLSAGIEPNVSAEDGETLALVEEVKKYGIGKPTKEHARESPIISSLTVGDTDSKKLKNLRKKLAQIEKLKEKQKNGEKLESNQLEKLNSEEEVRGELEHVEQLLSIPVKL